MSRAALGIAARSVETVKLGSTEGKSPTAKPERPDSVPSLPSVVGEMSRGASLRETGSRPSGQANLRCPDASRFDPARLQWLSLFSGIGGIDLGLERAGLGRTISFCERDKEAQAVLRKHWPGVPIYDDVRTLTADRLHTDGLRPNAVCGGFPCQDISLAGSGEGLQGSRSGLWSEYARVIGELRPNFVLVENVSALLGRGLGDVLGDLAALRYNAEWHCLPASYAGARQLRDRVWIVAYPERDGLQGRQTVTAAWCQQSRAEQLAGLVQPCSWPTVSGARDRRTGHGIPRGVHRNKQLGNAVNPQLVEMLGRALAIAIEAQRATTTKIGVVRSTKARAGTASPNINHQTG